MLSPSGEDHGHRALPTYDRPMDSEPPTTKREIRRALLARRRSMPAAAVAAASDAIVAVLRELPELATLAGRGTETRSVLLYAADPDEVDLGGLIDDHGPGGRSCCPAWWATRSSPSRTLLARRSTPATAGSANRRAHHSMRRAVP